MHKIIPIIVLLSLTACSTASYKRTAPDGTVVQVSGYEMGTDKALSGFHYEGDGKGASIIDIKSLNQKQTEALRQINMFVQSIVAGAISGAK